MNNNLHPKCQTCSYRKECNVAIYVLKGQTYDR